jgi:hypothetical protein
MWVPQMMKMVCVRCWRVKMRRRRARKGRAV